MKEKTELEKEIDVIEGYERLARDYFEEITKLTRELDATKRDLWETRGQRDGYKWIIDYDKWCDARTHATLAHQGYEGDICWRAHVYSDVSNSELAGHEKSMITECECDADLQLCFTEEEFNTED